MSSSHDSGILCCSSFPSGLAAADVNNDGVPDIVMSDEASGSFHIAAVTTASGLTVGSPVAVPSVSRISGFGLADFNGDGNIDLAGAEWGPGALAQNLIAIHQGQAAPACSIRPSRSPCSGTIRTTRIQSSLSGI